jgi:hypothetical protein
MGHKIDCDGVGQILLAMGRILLRAVTNTVMNPQIPWGWEFLNYEWKSKEIAHTVKLVVYVL